MAATGAERQMQARREFWRRAEPISGCTSFALWGRWRRRQQQLEGAELEGPARPTFSAAHSLLLGPLSGCATRSLARCCFISSPELLRLASPRQRQRQRQRHRQKQPTNQPNKQTRPAAGCFARWKPRARANKSAPPAAGGTFAARVRVRDSALARPTPHSSKRQQHQTIHLFICR